MGDLTDNFSRYEFACKCGCGFDTVDFDLVMLLQDLRDALSMEYGECSIQITGPNRCDKHNRNEGGAHNSTHKFAQAADFKVFIKRTREQLDPDIVANTLEEWSPMSRGIGRYNNRTHLDVRGTKARWDMREGKA